MGSKYSIFILAVISLTASAEWVDPSNTLGLPTVIANSLVQGVPAADSYYSPKSGRNTVDSKRPDTHGLDNKPFEGDRNQTVFGYALGGGSGSYSASAVGFGSSASSGGGQVNLGGAAQSDLNPANQIGGGNSLSRGVASASNNGIGYSDGVSPSYNNGSNTSVPGVNFPPATSTAANSANQIGGAPDSSASNAQATSQNSGSPTPTAQSLYQFRGYNPLPVSSPISGSFKENMENAGVTTILPTNLVAVGNSSNIFASILPGDISGGRSANQTTNKASYTDSVQSVPTVAGGYNLSTPLIIASNSPSQEAPTTSGSSPSSSSTPSSATNSSSTTTAGTNTTSTPPSSTSATSNATPSATSSSASNSGEAPSTTSTPASSTHSGGATAALAPTTGTPVTTAQNSTPAPESTTGGATLSSAGGGALPESQQGSASGLRTFDPTLPGGINKISLNSNDFQFAKINGSSNISNGDTVKTCIDKLNSYINSSTFTRSVDPTRNTVLNCVDSSSFNYLTNQSYFYKKLEEYYNKECSSIIKDPEYIAVIKLDPQSVSSNYYEKLKEYKNKKYPNSESGQLYINRCANIYRLLDKYNHFNKVEETYTNEDSNSKNPVKPHSSSESSDD